MGYIKNHPHCIEERAKKYYGITDVFEFAGYILPNGEMLNFSYGGYQRDEDHRNIGCFFSTAQGWEAMVKFMKRGNIRVCCSSSGFRFEFIRKPTKEQIQTMREAYRTARKLQMPFMIEQSSADGKRPIRRLGIYDLYDLEAA